MAANQQHDTRTGAALPSFLLDPCASHSSPFYGPGLAARPLAGDRRPGLCGRGGRSYLHEDRQRKGPSRPPQNGRSRRTNGLHSTDSTHGHFDGTEWPACAPGNATERMDTRRGPENTAPRPAVLST